MKFLKKFKLAYNGNDNLKKVGAPLDYTENQLVELSRCMDDPKYFIRNYCKIVSLDKGLINFRLFQYQEKFIDAVHNNRKVISMQPRQSGKTQTVAT